MHLGELQYDVECLLAILCRQLEIATLVHRVGPASLRLQSVAATIALAETVGGDRPVRTVIPSRPSAAMNSGVGWSSIRMKLSLMDSPNPLHQPPIIHQIRGWVPRPISFDV